MPHRCHESPHVAMRMICRVGSVVGCILMAGCSARHARQGSSPQPTSAQRSLYPGSISEHGPLGEHTLAEYKRYYERFRHIEDVQRTLPIQQEARLARDYAFAREEFHSWLWFVTDTIQQQSQLEPAFREGQPDNEYCQRTARAAAALSAFDRDLSDLPLDRSAGPPLSSVQLLYDLGRGLIVTFSNLDPDSARVAGDELLMKYSWNKQ
jgi:hypothetical protein